MNTTYSEKLDAASQNRIWERSETAKILSEFKLNKQRVSVRAFAGKSGTPRSTLRHWLARKERIDADPALIEFLEGSVGASFLHRLVISAHLEFTKSGTASIHNISNFLEMAGLSPFIASSYSAQRRVSKQMDDEIIRFGETEDKRLSQQMPTKKISLCEDETFHPDICLVAIEPVSNFILVEKYAENRKAETWDNAVGNALKKFPIDVIQVASDEGRSLINHALKGLKVHHSSDCFHVIYEIGKGTSGALASQVKKTESAYVAAAKQTLKVIDLKGDYDSAIKRPRGRRPDFEKRIDQAEEKEEQAEQRSQQAVINQDVVRNAKAEIGQVYHPYNLDTGQMQDSQAVSGLLEDCFGRINVAISGLSDRCKDRVDKAHRVVKNMVTTIAFFFRMVELCLDNLHLTNHDRRLMHNYLIPGYYLRLAAQREKNTDRKKAILQKAEELLSVARNPDGPFREMTESTIKRMEDAAMQCAQYFQRSSSCVEGRNAQLALRHQGIHRLGNRHLKALTVVHNYFIKRRDGTTAAERFFEAKPNELFDFLLKNMNGPSRPRNHFKKAA